MKSKKEFFGVLLSVLFCVFLVFLFVYATTTVGDDVTVGGDLVVNGLASISETLRVPTILGNTDAGLYLRIGDVGTTGHGLDAEDDLMVTGELEVTASAFFDNVVSVSDSGIVLDGGATITSGVGSASDDCIVGSIYFRTDASDMSQILNLCDVANEWTAASISEP